MTSATLFGSRSQTMSRLNYIKSAVIAQVICFVIIKAENLNNLLLSHHPACICHACMSCRGWFWELTLSSLQITCSPKWTRQTQGNYNFTFPLYLLLNDPFSLFSTASRGIVGSLGGQL